MSYPVPDTQAGRLRLFVANLREGRKEERRERERKREGGKEGGRKGKGRKEGKKEEREGDTKKGIEYIVWKLILLP